VDNGLRYLVVLCGAVAMVQDAGRYCNDGRPAIVAAAVASGFQTSAEHAGVFEERIVRSDDGYDCDCARSVFCEFQ